MKFWKYNFNMSADCRNFLEMVLTNTVMEVETERHANAGGSRTDTVSGPKEKVLQSRCDDVVYRVPMISPMRRLTLVSE